MLYVKKKNIQYLEFLKKCKTKYGIAQPGKAGKRNFGLQIADWRNRFALSFLLTSMAPPKYSIRLGHKSCANMMGFEQIGTNNRLAGIATTTQEHHFIKMSLKHPRFPVNGCAARIGNRHRGIGQKPLPKNAKRNELRCRTTLPVTPLG